MRRMRIRCASLLVLSLLAAAACEPAVVSTEVVLDPGYYTDLYDYDNGDTLLRRGINLGNYFEAPPSVAFPNGEGEWSGRLVEADDFTIMAGAGFKTVRIPIRWSAHALIDPPYTVDATFMARIKTVVDQAIDAGLRVVINCHHYNEMFDSADGTALSIHQARLAAIWDQICDEFPIASYAADELVFELLNEPNGRVGYALWNDLIDELVTAIWTDHAATQAGRRIMVGTANWGGVTGLNYLDLPDACTSANTIVTVHYYEPFHFTHQGAGWVSGSDDWIGTPWTGSAADRAPLIDLLDGVMSWNAAADRGFEIFMGEFGAYGQYARDDHRKAWTAFIAREAEHRLMSWAYWEYSSGFGAYDLAVDDWRPELIDALVPLEDRP